MVFSFFFDAVPLSILIFIHMISWSNFRCRKIVEIHENEWRIIPNHDYLLYSVSVFRTFLSIFPNLLWHLALFGYVEVKCCCSESAIKYKTTCLSMRFLTKQNRLSLFKHRNIVLCFFQHLMQNPYSLFLPSLCASVFIIIISLYVHTCYICCRKEEKLDTLTSRTKPTKRAGGRLLLGNWITSIEYQKVFRSFFMGFLFFIQRIFICLVEHSFRKQFRVKQKL